MAISKVQSPEVARKLCNLICEYLSIGLEETNGRARMFLEFAKGNIELALHELETGSLPTNVIQFPGPAQPGNRPAC